MHLTRVLAYTPVFAIAALAVLLDGCASTTLSSEWKNPNYTGGPLRKMAVFVVSKDDNMRRFAEDQVVQRLPKGTAGVAGYSMFPQLADADKERDKVRARLVQEGFDSVLVSRLVSHDQTQTYIPPQTHFVPAASAYGPYYGSFYGYYGFASTYAYTTPGYTLDTTTIVVETIVYKLPEDTPVWAGTTQTIDPRSKAEMVQAIATIVDNELTRQGLVGTAGK